MTAAKFNSAADGGGGYMNNSSGPVVHAFFVFVRCAVEPCSFFFLSENEGGLPRQITAFKHLTLNISTYPLCPDTLPNLFVTFANTWSLCSCTLVSGLGGSRSCSCKRFTGRPLRFLWKILL